MTTSTQWLRSVADSHRNRSVLYRLSFACPKNVSHDGPFESDSGRYFVASTRRTMSLSISISKASPIWRAILGHPHRGFRLFISTMAATNSRDGPLGPGRPRRVGENSKRHLRVRKYRWKSRIVDGLSTMAERTTRVGRMKSEHTPARSRSDARRFSARCRERLGDHRASTAGTHQPSRRGNQVNQQNEQVAHRDILPTSPKITRRDISQDRGAD
jgi:hypothetical protein